MRRASSRCTTNGFNYTSSYCSFLFRPSSTVIPTQSQKNYTPKLFTKLAAELFRLKSRTRAGGHRGDGKCVNTRISLLLLPSSFHSSLSSAPKEEFSEKNKLNISRHESERKTPFETLLRASCEFSQNFRLKLRCLTKNATETEFAVTHICGSHSSTLRGTPAPSDKFSQLSFHRRK